MGFGADFPGNEHGGPEKVWVRTEYGVWQIWVISESTVVYSVTVIFQVASVCNPVLWIINLDLFIQGLDNECQDLR